jgi:hypothetical protein
LRFNSDFLLENLDYRIVIGAGVPVLGVAGVRSGMGV